MSQTPLASFKDLCIDANDPVLVGEFWAGVLGLDYHVQDGGDTYLTGPTKQHTIWVNKVPEPKSVKHRVHIDVNVHDVAEVEKLGGTVLDGTSYRWTVLADPEGGELCAFVREGEIERRLYEVCVDCSPEPGAARRLADWWQRVLGGSIRENGTDVYLEDVPGLPFDSFVFGPVPEPKTVKNRIHPDVTGRWEDLVEAGATVLRAKDGGIGWTVMADPGGNEFCCFAP